MIGSRLAFDGAGDGGEEEGGEDGKDDKDVESNKDGKDAEEDVEAKTGGEDGDEDGADVQEGGRGKGPGAGASGSSVGGDVPCNTGVEWGETLDEEKTEAEKSDQMVGFVEESRDIVVSGKIKADSSKK